MLGHNQRTHHLDFVQSMLRQLVEISKGERYDVLAWLIEMAYVEASDIARGSRPPRLEQPKAGTPAATQDQAR